MHVDHQEGPAAALGPRECRNAETCKTNRYALPPRSRRPGRLVCSRTVDVRRGGQEAPWRPIGPGEEDRCHGPGHRQARFHARLQRYREAVQGQDAVQVHRPGCSPRHVSRAVGPQRGRRSHQPHRGPAGGRRLASRNAGPGAMPQGPGGVEGRDRPARQGRQAARPSPAGRPWPCGASRRPSDPKSRARTLSTSTSWSSRSSKASATAVTPGRRRGS